MPLMLKESLESLVVADLKDLISHLPQAKTLGCKDELIENIIFDCAQEVPRGYTFAVSGGVSGGATIKILFFA